VSEEDSRPVTVSDEARNGVFLILRPICQQNSHLQSEIGKKSTKQKPELRQIDAVLRIARKSLHKKFRIVYSLFEEECFVLDLQHCFPEVPPITQNPTFDNPIEIVLIL
jgi:hypothetical protein